MKLKDKVILVTGGSGHIGRIIVKDIISEGGNVILISRNINKTKKFISELSSYQKKKCYFNFSRLNYNTGM